MAETGHEIPDFALRHSPVLAENLIRPSIFSSLYQLTHGLFSSVLMDKFLISTALKYLLKSSSNAYMVSV